MAAGYVISYDLMNGDSIIGIPRTVRENKGKSKLEFIDDYIVLDLETTGFDPSFDEIIEVAAVKYSKGNRIAEFVTLVKPENEIDDFIIKLTGITNEMVKDAPKAIDVFPKLLDFLGDSVIIAHNANFDVNFVYDNVMAFYGKPFTNDFIDTMRLSRRLFKNIRHRLADLIEAFEISVYEQHRALADCDVTQLVYEYMKSHCSINNINLNDLVSSSHGRSFDLKGFKPETDQFDENHPIYGKSICFTGTLEKFQRKDALQLVVNLGGIPADSITQNTNFLVLGNNDYCSTIKNGKSNKQKKAEDIILRGFDLMIISEKAFYDML